MKARLATYRKTELVVLHSIDADKCTIENKEGELVIVDAEYIRFIKPILVDVPLESITPELANQIKENLKYIN